MYTMNNNIRDYLGVTEWHNQGYFGKGIKVLSAESVTTTDDSEHSTQTRTAFQEIAPQSDLVHFDVYITDTQIQDFIDNVKKENCITGFRSKSVYTSNENRSSNYDSYFDQVPNFTLFNASGNEDTSGYSQLIAENGIFGVGAVMLLNGTTVLEEFYSSESQYVDFVSFSRLQVTEMYQPISGTSISAPVLCGMVALVQEFFFEKTGQYLNRATIYQFIVDNCDDLSVDGKDNKTGYGLFRLPKPEDIDIEKYVNIHTTETTTETKDEDKNMENVASWAKDGYTYVTENGISDGTRPQDNITREEIWVMLERLSKLDNK